MTWALVPVKALASAKRRLSPVLRPTERYALSVAMLADVLGTLVYVPALAGRLVVGRDAVVRELAEAMGAEFLPEPPGSRGLNRAVSIGLAELTKRGAKRVLILPSDVPLVRPADVNQLLRSGPPSPSVSLTPSRDGRGTNALLLAPPDVIRPRFGAKSAAAHAAAARSARVELLTVDLPRIALDIDEPGDISAFLQQAVEGATVAFLRGLRADQETPQALRSGG